MSTPASTSIIYRYSLTDVLPEKNSLLIPSACICVVNIIEAIADSDRNDAAARCAASTFLLFGILQETFELHQLHKLPLNYKIAASELLTRQSKAVALAVLSLLYVFLDSYKNKDHSGICDVRNIFLLFAMSWQAAVWGSKPAGYTPDTTDLRAEPV